MANRGIFRATTKRHWPTLWPFGIWQAGDALIDLVDFCVRKLRYLIATPNDELVRQVASAKECTEWDTVRMLDEQFAECEFQICMCVISIIRFLTDHRVAVPLAVTTRMLETHDILLLLVPLMEKAPWVRRNRINGRIEKFEEHKWQVVEACASERGCAGQELHVCHYNWILQR
ncbi:unnamed protein product [Effrenium voratum]|uniref:Uncharacterized protein n=1 Tax=Effrenium voratum TaxID=2562239 RepID=A0AA36HR38_9DINO|nr:unnamed protein product [Effrenium voratum]